MKIAQIAPLIERVPPKQYGGTERVVSALTEELVKRGHKVTLFASSDSITSAKLVSIFPTSLREARVAFPTPSHLWTLSNAGIAYQKQEEFDIIHDHNGTTSLPIATVSTTPVVMTLHGAFNKENKKIFKKLLKNRSNVNFVSISNSQREPLPSLNYQGTVYNGLPMNHYPFSATHDGYLLFVGRISKEKGVHNAVRVAKALSLPLIIAAKLEDYNLDYYERYIKLYLSDSIRVIGEVDERKRNKLMSKALCFLHPTTWREPFGLTLIEAMACGAPVVAYNKGAIPEVIKDGKTGFVVDSFHEMLERVKNINSINRAECREYALNNFSVEKMTDGYEALYQKILIEETLRPKTNYVSNNRFEAQIIQNSFSNLQI